MSLTLTANISATAYQMRVTGTVPSEIAAGYTFRLDDELMTLVSFVESATRFVPDRNHWNIQRGTGTFVNVAHTAGATIKGALDGFVNGDDEDEPDPFASGGGGGGPVAAEDVTLDPAVAGAEDVQAALEAGVYFATVDFTADQLRTSGTDKPVVIASPGPGKVLGVSQCGGVVTNHGIPFASMSGGLNYQGEPDIGGTTDIVFDGSLIRSIDASFDANFAWNTPLWDPQGSFFGDMALFEDKPLILLGSDDPSGAINADALGDGGADYEGGDTFSVDAIGTALGVVDTIDGGGAVLTYHLTANGYGYVPGAGTATTATTGIGTGLTIDIDSITPANATARAWVMYSVLTLP